MCSSQVQQDSASRSQNDLFVPISPASEAFVLHQSRQDVFHFHLTETATQKEKVRLAEHYHTAPLTAILSQRYDFFFFQRIRVSASSRGLCS